MCVCVYGSAFSLIAARCANNGRRVNLLEARSLLARSLARDAAASARQRRAREARPDDAVKCGNNTCARQRIRAGFVIVRWASARTRQPGTVRAGNQMNYLSASEREKETVCVQCLLLFMYRPCICIERDRRAIGVGVFGNSEWQVYRVATAPPPLHLICLAGRQLEGSGRQTDMQVARPPVYLPRLCAQVREIRWF